VTIKQGIFMTGAVAGDIQEKKPVSPVRPLNRPDHHMTFPKRHTRNAVNACRMPFPGHWKQTAIITQL